MPKVFESDVIFAPGKGPQARENGTEVGYLCYSHQNERRVIFTRMQYNLNLFSDIMVLLVVIISSGISVWGFKTEVKHKRNKLEADQLKLFRYNVITTLKEKRLNITVCSICITYIVLRLPLYVLGQIEINHIGFGIGFCFFLYNMQFCIHFLIYAIGGKDYREAYRDMLNLIFPCCCKRQTTNNSMHGLLRMKTSYN